jgi:hypothetical protein
MGKKSETVVVTSAKKSGVNVLNLKIPKFQNVNVLSTETALF